MAIQSVSHLGICVSDLERSTRFYCDVLGFQEQFTMTLGDEVAATMGVRVQDGISFVSRSLARPDLRVELLWWERPGPTGDGELRPMTQLGLTHLCLRVDDVEDLRDAAEAAGGTYHAETLSALPGMGVDGADVRLVYLSDPDGVRIECMSGTPDFSLPRN